MAVLVFENTTQDQANSFTAADFLVFSSSSANALNTTFTPVATGSALQVSSSGKSLIFSTNELSNASTTGHVAFNDGSSVVLGTTGADAALSGTVVYGFDGNDGITLSGTGYGFGGAGADTITGGAGNDHIYGQSAAGGTDGADSLVGGAGNDYIQGNGGADTIDGGVGSDRIFGGSGDDSIIGNDGNDTINGNLGNDNIDAGNGNDSVRGGQGDDIILGGTGNDLLFGDLGNDSITGGANADIMTGGDGADTFTFRTTDAQADAVVSGTTTTTFYDTITDFVKGTDKVNFFATAGTVTLVVGSTTATFSQVSAAQVYAQQLLDTNTAGTAGEVAAVQVGSDTYLFSNTAGGEAATINAIVKLTGLTGNTAVAVTDFIAG